MGAATISVITKHHGRLKKIPKCIERAEFVPLIQPNEVYLVPSFYKRG